MQQQISQLKTFFQTHRISWPITLSIALHLSLVAALIYASIKTLIHLPEPTEQESIKAVMINTNISTTAKAETVSEEKSEISEAKQEVKPEPKTTNKVDAIIKPMAKPPSKVVVKQKPLKKEKVKPKPVEKTVDMPVRAQRVTESHSTENSKALFSSRNESHSLPANAASRSNSPVKTSPAASASSSASVGPKAISRGKPAYPSRAYALKIEGKVKVRYDVDNDGNVSNIEIVSAEPSNMFEREVKLAMKKWRYEPGKAGKGISSTFYFRIDGSTSIN